MKKLNKEERFALDIVEVINGLFDKDSESYKHNIAEIDLTAFFTGFLIANKVMLSTISGDNNLDVLDVLSQNTRLFMQYSERELGKEREDEVVQ